MRRYRTAILIGILFVPLAFYAHASWNRHRDKERADSLRELSFPIQSIAPDYDDDRDLEPLVDLIGDRRFVLLAEATHAGGATFDARARLITFLHRRLGFDVVAIESNFLDMHRINLQVGDIDEYRAMTSAYAGLHPVRTQRALFDYVHKTRVAGERPIHVMGLHPVYTGADKTYDRCKQFFSKASVSPLTDTEWKDFRRLMERFCTNDETQREKPQSSDVGRMLDLTSTLRKATESNRAALEQVHGHDEVWATEAVISSLPAFLETLTMDHPHDVVRDRRQLEGRDKAMAQFIRSAAERRFPNSKFIITGATYHVVRQHDALSVKSMADFLHEQLRDQTYTIVFEPFSGSTGTEDHIVRIRPAAHGTLSEMLHRSGDAFRYLDLAHLPRDHWLRRTPLGTHRNRLGRQRQVIWPERCDGVFFLAEEGPIARRPH